MSSFRGLVTRNCPPPTWTMLYDPFLCSGRTGAKATCIIVEAHESVSEKLTKRLRQFSAVVIRRCTKVKTLVKTASAQFTRKGKGCHPPRVRRLVQRSSSSTFISIRKTQAANTSYVIHHTRDGAPPGPDWATFPQSYYASGVVPCQRYHAAI